MPIEYFALILILVIPALYKLKQNKKDNDNED
ncbi:hypothetical protein C5L21_000526 [Leuconostoc citreum]|nr:hypothetical protein C5L21_000526 [Leuconostoc citreum]